ncbi:MAG TPA: cytochrome c biogenesis protein CcdA [Candidatus Binataceae bacterium]|nr:cytochrome c biogenesis protein CcdA [Candidatus Binataceae bacterium]
MGTQVYRKTRELISQAFIAILALAVMAGVANAQAPKPGDLVKIDSTTIEPALKAGGKATLTVAATVAPGWHINSDKPLSQDYIATKVEIGVPSGVTAGAVNYPPAEMMMLEVIGEKISVFGGKLKFEAPLAASADFSPKAGDALKVTIDYQGCNNNECLRPASVSTTIDLAPSKADAGAVTAAGAITGMGGAAGGGDGGLSGGAIARIFASHGWLLGFIAVFIGGMALNLTPCVYPLIGVTVAYFGNQSGGPRRVLILAILYVLGIAVTFSALGVAAALSGGLFGAALQNPYVLVTIAAMMLALAASSFGFFTIQAPQRMLQWAGAARPGYAGAALMGLGMGVVAAPCIGPIVLGLLLMVEQSGSALFGFALFFTLAIGMGAPYVALALAAGHIRRLPRSGEWLAWVEQLFGFVLAGLAIYFLDPVVPNHLMSRILPYYAAGAGIFLGFISPHGRAWRPFLLFRSAVGAAAIAVLAFAVYPHKASQSLKFEPFNHELLASAQEARKPVLLDFSADWCIPCREMEHSTFVDPSVVHEAQRFVRLKANLTADDKANETLADQFSVQGVPTTLIIDSKGKVQERKVGYVSPQEMLADLRQVD